MVTLAEDLYLVACDDTTGRLLIEPAHLDLGLGGALLLDLAMRQRVALVGGHLTVTGDAPTGEPLLDATVAAVVRPGRAHGPDHWVRHLARGAHRVVQDRLVDVGVLKRDDHRLLRVIPLHRTHETDGRLHHELADHLHDAVVLGHPSHARNVRARPAGARLRARPAPVPAVGPRRQSGGASGRSPPAVPTASRRGRRWPARSTTWTPPWGSPRGQGRSPDTPP